MYDIKAKTEALCLISIFAGVMGALIPQGKLKNAFSAFCALAIVFSTVSPLAEIKTEGISLFNMEENENNELLLANVKTAEASVYESVIGSAVEKELEKLGYAADVIACCKVQDGEIRVISFTVAVNADEAVKDEIEAYLKKSFGDVGVSFEVTENND